MLVVWWCLWCGGDIAVVAVGGDVWHSCVGGWGDTAGGGLSTSRVVSTGWLRWCQPVAAGRTPRRESNFKRPGVISCNLRRLADEVSSQEILMHGRLVWCSLARFAPEMLSEIARERSRERKR